MRHSPTPSARGCHGLRTGGPEPLTRSLTVLETSTSPAFASDATRATSRRGRATSSRRSESIAVAASARPGGRRKRPPSRDLPAAGGRRVAVLGAGLVQCPAEEFMRAWAQLLPSNDAPIL